jgi:hypothetical protein
LFASAAAGGRGPAPQRGRGSSPPHRYRPRSRRHCGGFRPHQVSPARIFAVMVLTAIGYRRDTESRRREQVGAKGRGSARWTKEGIEQSAKQEVGGIVRARRGANSEKQGQGTRSASTVATVTDPQAQRTPPWDLITGRRGGRIPPRACPSRRRHVPVTCRRTGDKLLCVDGWSTEAQSLNDVRSHIVGPR